MYRPRCEGQISQQLIRRALAAIGVHSPTLGDQMAECYEVLDPEATGTMSFSELHSELRRVRKLLTPMSGPQQTGGARRRGVRAVGSAPLQRAPQGFRHEDGSPYTAVELENAAANFRRQGELGQALRALEAALADHSRVHGERSEVAIECSRQVADVCNSLGMQMLQRDDFVGCHALLRRAQARGQGDRAMFAITLNNLACYHRRRGHLKVALAHLSRRSTSRRTVTARTSRPTLISTYARSSQSWAIIMRRCTMQLALRLLRRNRSAAANTALAVERFRPRVLSVGPAHW